MLDLVMMALGAFRFGIGQANYQNFTHEAAFRWEKVDRVGRAPALQYLGPDAETITLEGVIYPHYRGGLRQVDLMRTQARLGQPLILVDGLGFVWKRWVIAQVSEKRSVLWANGAPRRIDFTVQLMAYGGDLA